MLRVRVVSSSPLLRAGLCAVLEQAGGFEVAGASASFAELSSEPPEGLDVLVAELGDGEEALLGDPGAEGWPAIVLLVDREDANVGEWLADGISVVSRDAPAEGIVAAARAAAAGLVASARPFVSAALRFARMPQASAVEPGQEPLTAREAQVLAKLAQGLGNKAIAEALHISSHTAKFHVAQVMAKLNATSRAQAVAKALRAGLVHE